MKILVITDFSETSKQALQYAIDLVAATKGNIELAHVVDDSEDADSAHTTLVNFIKQVNTKGIEIKHTVLLGDLYDQVGVYTKMHAFDLLLFGTHGAHGLQKIFGSHAVKLIQHTTCPCIVVQKEIAIGEDGIKEIALPLTLEVEDKKILAHVTELAQLLDAKIEIIYQDNTDEFLGATIKRNLNFTVSHFEKAGLKYSVNQVDEGKNFNQEVINISDAKECDLIAIVNHHEDGVKNLFGWSFDQNMIENNKHIPVLTIDAKPAGNVNDIFSTTR